jgi:hypothetical protein
MLAVWAIDGTVTGIMAMEEDVIAAADMDMEMIVIAKRITDITTTIMDICTDLISIGRTKSET